MEEVMNQVINYILPIAVTGLAGVLSAVGLKIKALYQEKINTELKQKAVEITVKYVQQAYGDIGGEEKLTMAISKATEYLSSKGITIDVMELSMMIEATVKDMNVWVSETILTTDEVVATDEVVEEQEG